MKKVGMHVHSCVSDGKDRPSLLIRKAVQENLSAVCLTDHDLYHGIEEFQAEAKKYGLKTIPAMEVSAHWQNRSFVHLLAYGIDYPGKELLLRESLRKNWEAHDAEYDEIMERLVMRYSVNFSRETIKEKIGQMGPVNFVLPTIRFLEGYLGIEKGEFKRFAFDDRYTFENPVLQGLYLSIEEAMELIKSAGGKAVLAHPGMFSTYTIAGGTSVKDFEELFFSLVDLGLSGIETYYPNHAREQTEYFEDLALRCCLWKTAGSDYHGEYKPNCGMSMPGMSYEDFLRFKDFCER
ncbi:MAG: PHP domain-containing protein [Syntrophobacteraceae bacterium]